MPMSVFVYVCVYVCVERDVTCPYMSVFVYVCVCVWREM